MSEIHRMSEMDNDERYAYLQRVTSKRTDYMMLFDHNGGKEWPTQCDELCRWCMHKFDTFPIGIPIRFDEARHKMILRGYFCSFACADAYAYDASINSTTLGRYWLGILAQRAFGLRRIIRAPPREMLNRLTIEEFRDASQETCYSIGPSEYFSREIETLQVNRVLSPEEEYSSRTKRQSSTRSEADNPTETKRQRLETQLNRFDRNATASTIQSPRTIRRLQEEKEAQRSNVLSILGATRRKIPAS